MTHYPEWAKQLDRKALRLLDHAERSGAMTLKQARAYWVRYEKAVFRLDKVLGLIEGKRKPGRNR
jgi:hypothetical protein